MLDATARQLITRYFDLDAAQADALRAEFDTVHVAGGEWLFRQGDPGDALYFVLRGRLQVWLDDGAEPRWLADQVAGEVIGEIALLSTERRTAGVRAARDSALLRLDRDTFERLVNRHPVMGVRLASHIAERLHDRTSRPAGATRDLVNLCVVPLQRGVRTARFCAALTGALGRFGPVLSVAPRQLAGAPVSELAPGQPVPAELADWLDDCEDRHRFVVYHCDAHEHDAATPWSRMAVRQADLVVLVGDATQPAPIRPWEGELLGERATGAARRALLLLQPPRDIPISGSAAWLAGRAVDFHLHARAGEEDDLQRIARVLSGNAIGLVLGSGAARGIAHLGVYRALREFGVPIDWIGGSSIGGMLGAAMAHDWSPDHLERTLRPALVDNRPFSDFTIPMMSLLRGNRIVRSTEPYRHVAIEDLPIPFFCVSSNLEDGTLNVHRSGPVAPAILAGAALPGILPPRVFERRLVVDGAVLNALPVDVMRQCPVGQVLAVDVSSRKLYQLDYDDLPSPWRLLRQRLLPFGRRYRVPNLVTLLLKSAEIGTLEHVRELGEGADLLFNPPVREFGMTQVSAFDRIIDAGYRHARERLLPWLEGNGLALPPAARDPARQEAGQDQDAAGSSSRAATPPSGLRPISSVPP